MVKVKDILREIEHYAPLPLQEGFDNAGVQVGDVNGCVAMPRCYRGGAR